jgi:hypothetical protein
MYPDDTILECSCVKFGTSTAGRLSCAQSAVLGDAIGVALKYATVGAPERIPVMLHGIIKMLTGGSSAVLVTAGKGVMNSITTTVHATADVGTYTDANNAMFVGASHTLGMAMHTGAAAAGDEVLIHVGHSL